MNNKQTSETEWINENGSCKIRIEINGDLELDDVQAQWESTLKGCGYISENE
ncbi:MAG: hypothetical protein KKH70_20440 [Gammaproteobacteria bacterium]|nr:hypothetical protein [Gammaproteobacteria bacterium]